MYVKGSGFNEVGADSGWVRLHVSSFPNGSETLVGMPSSSELIQFLTYSESDVGIDQGSVLVTWHELIVDIKQRYLFRMELSNYKNLISNWITRIIPKKNDKS